jgi:hypothetical protein
MLMTFHSRLVPFSAVSGVPRGAPPTARAGRAAEALRALRERDAQRAALRANTADPGAAGQLRRLEALLPHLERAATALRRRAGGLPHA